MLVMDRLYKTRNSSTSMKPMKVCREENRSMQSCEKTSNSRQNASHETPKNSLVHLVGLPLDGRGKLGEVVCKAVLLLPFRVQS